jgi:hypothetical protein
MAVDKRDAPLPPVGERPFDLSAKPIWEIFEQISNELPEEDLKKLPPDASEHLDSYLYGTGKKAR